MTAPDTFGLHAAWAAGRVAFQTCQACNAVQHPPGHVCAACRSTSLAVCDVAGRGELLAASEVRRAPEARFAADVPYVLGVVRLTEGALVQVRLAGDGWTTGEPVELVAGSVDGRPVPTGRRTT